MNEVTRFTLLELFKKRCSSPFVFVDTDDQPIEIHHVYRTFGLCQKKALLGRRIRFHDLRHTFATQFIMNGGSVFDLQKILGHTIINMTMRYAHYSQEHLQKAMSNFNLGTHEMEFNQILTTDDFSDKKVVYL